MKFFLFIYNIFLIIIYTSPLILSIILYKSSKKNIYNYFAILSSLYLLDNSFIYMSEFIESFTPIYNLQFISIPILKTFIFIGIGVIYFVIQNNILLKNLKPIDYVLFTLFTVSLLFIPVSIKEAIMVWLYYLPFQLLTIYLGISGIKYLNTNPNLFQEYNFLNNYKKLLYLLVIISVLIIIEDSIVIFCFDVYSVIGLKVNSRSISNDLFNIVVSISALRYCLKNMNTLFSNTEDAIIEKKDSNIKDAFFDHYDLAFYDFSKCYNLTNREQDILKLLIDGKTNQDISNELFISIGTVKTHIHNIFQKVEVNKRNELLSCFTDYKVIFNNNDN